MQARIDANLSCRLAKLCSENRHFFNQPNVTSQDSKTNLGSKQQKWTCSLHGPRRNFAAGSSSPRPLQA